MPKQIFDNDEPLFDYGAIDELAAMGIGDRGYTEVNPPVGSDELFHDQFERRASEIHRNPSNLTPACIIPQKSGPWSRNPQLGSVQDFQPAANNEQTILKLDEWDAPQVWSVMLGLTFSDTSADFSVIAKIRPGTGGFTEEFEMDWQPGVTFNVCMNAINIIASYDNVTSVPNNLRLSAMLAKRPLHGTSPQRTFRSTVAGGGGVDVIRIPKYAKRLHLIAADTAPHDLFLATTNIKFLSGSNGAGLGLGDITGDEIGPLYQNNIPIPGGAKSIRIANAAVGNVIVQCVFDLAL